MDSYFQDGHGEAKQNGLLFDLQETVSTPYAKCMASSPVIPKNNIFENLEQESDSKPSSKKNSAVPGKRLGSSYDEAMDFSWSNGGPTSLKNVNANPRGELRWRTDESSEEDEAGTPLKTRTMRRARRSRLPFFYHPLRKDKGNHVKPRIKS